MQDTEPPALEGHSALTTEARRQEAIRHGGWQQRLLDAAGPGTRVFVVVRRVWTGVYQDGFIHAGNLAYMALLSLFPFFIATAAILSALGEQSQREASVNAVLAALPRSVAGALGPVAQGVVQSRQGWLLWVGGAVGLWTASSLVETIRDILHRAYGVRPARAFWEYRLGSIGLIFASVLLLLTALGAQVAITAIQQFLYSFFPRLDGFFDGLFYSRLLAGLVLYLSNYVLFRSLTPRAYQMRRYPKWPGALLVTLWWTVLTLTLPTALRTFFTYDLTYGSLAGVMIALFFFWLVGLGMVVGAELNAGLAVAPEERDAAEAGNNRKQRVEHGE